MKPSKYRNIPTVVDGKRFASRREAKRYSELRLMEKAGEIQFLTTQPRYEITVNGQKICTYVGDFYYEIAEGGGFHVTVADKLLPIPKRVVEDAKGVKTQVYRLKKRLMKAVHGIEIQEV